MRQIYALDILRQLAKEAAETEQIHQTDHEDNLQQGKDRFFCE